MSEHDEAAFRPAKVIAKFRSSSTKGGGEGYEVMVTDAADEGDVHDAVALAKLARRQMLAALDGTDDFARAVAEAEQ